MSIYDTTQPAVTRPGRSTGKNTGKNTGHSAAEVSAPAGRTQASRSIGTAELATVARVVTYIWIAVSAVNTVVWAAVSAVSGSIDSPWFLWAFAFGGVVVGALRFAARSAARRDGSS